LVVGAMERPYEIGPADDADEPAVLDHREPVDAPRDHDPRRFADRGARSDRHGRGGHRLGGRAREDAGAFRVGLLEQPAEHAARLGDEPLFLAEDVRLRHDSEHRAALVADGDAGDAIAREHPRHPLERRVRGRRHHVLRHEGFDVHARSVAGPCPRGIRLSADPRYGQLRMDLALLDSALSELGQPAYRAGQVWSWATRGAAGYGAMTDVPRALREELAERVPFSTLTLVTERESSDGTIKVLFRTGDGHPVEAVLMRYRDGRRSLCLSSQSGCPLTCTFCATGQMAFGRNLTASEILDQALHFRRLTEVDHAVFMGMGEPMLNLDEVLDAARRLPDVGITHRRTTISTVGWLPGLRRFVDEVDEPIRLALSLHAADAALRSELMPVNDRYPLDAVLAECARYVALRGRKVFVEYVLLAGVND